MRLQGITAGDIVHCDVRGHKAYAKVVDVVSGELLVEPITPGFNYRRIRSPQVTEHWRKRRKRPTS